MVPRTSGRTGRDWSVDPARAGHRAGGCRGRDCADSLATRGGDRVARRHRGAWGCGGCHAERGDPGCGTRHHIGRFLQESWGCQQWNGAVQYRDGACLAGDRAVGACHAGALGALDAWRRSSGPGDRFLSVGVVLLLLRRCSRHHPTARLLRPQATRWCTARGRDRRCGLGGSCCHLGGHPCRAIRWCWRGPARRCGCGVTLWLHRILPRRIGHRIHVGPGRAGGCGAHARHQRRVDR